jgi:hypothetical protein
LKVPARPSPKPSLLGVGALFLAALGVGAVVWVLLGGLPAAAPSPSTLATPTARVTRDPLEPLTIPSIQRGPHLIFQNVIRGDDYAKTSLVPLDSPGGMRLTTGLICERVHFAAGHGICLTAEHGAESHYFAALFGADFVPTSRVPLDGAPTFARVSPDGRMAAASFQTSPPEEEAPFAPSETWLLDTQSGQVVADLADFQLLRDSVQVTEPEVDYWGVTFKRDSNGFYASVRFGGNIYLVEGNIAAKRLVVLNGGLSAPSLSPDGTRVAYASLVSSIGPTWRFHVLDLTSMVDTALSETRSIDDQMEWLDNDELLYGLATDVWRVAADGSGQPSPFLFGGLSPAVVEPL